MAEKILMPHIGMIPSDLTITKWNFCEGDNIAEGDILCSVESAKTASEVESEYSGVLLKIIVHEELAAAPGSLIAVIGSAGELLTEKFLYPSVPDADNSSVTNEEQTSVVVVGAGPGGYVAAIRAAQLGAKVSLVEANKLGGTCLNNGCIPTKCLIHSAEFFQEIKENANEQGIEIDTPKVNYSRLLNNRDRIISSLRTGIERLVQANKIELIQGTASFSAPKTLQVVSDGKTTRELKADKIILATGAESVMPPIAGVKGNENCIDAKGLLGLQSLPESLVIMGGGVIGMEFASAFAMLGTKVTVIEMMPKVLSMIDDEIAQIGVAHLRKLGVEFHMGTTVKEVLPEDNGKCTVHCASKDNEEQFYCAEKVLIAVGRRPNVSELNLNASGIDTYKNYIVVNDRMETSSPDVYAIGDCVFGKAQLAHTASAMGEVAAENALGISSTYDQSTSPSCVYIAPECASVGITEDQAKAQDIACLVGRFPLAASGKALILNGGEGLVKIIAEKVTQRILGMHMIGPRATDLISEGAMAIKMKATIHDLIDTIHSHPTVSESIREAALAVEHRAIHI